MFRVNGPESGGSRIMGGMISSILTVLTMSAASCAFVPAQAEIPKSKEPQVYQPVAGAPVAGNFAYDRYVTTDGFGRRITFYLSKVPEGGGGVEGAGKKEKLPLVLCVQGSGSQSVFLEVDSPEGKRIASGGPEAVVLSQFKGKVRVLVVEKPGVEFLVQAKRPGGAEEGAVEFRREHTLERWVEALKAAVKAALTLPGVDASRVLALGHSEGGQVVCHVAAANAAVTHVAAMAGGGPTQLFDLIELARSGAMGPPQGTEDERVAWIVEQWKEVLKDPDADGKFFLGHPHRRWTSFLKSSPIEGILKSKARVFVAQGSKDTATLPASTDALYAELLARGRDVTYERVEGGDHGFMTSGDKGEGWKVTHRKAVEWFLGGGGVGAAVN